MQNIAKVGKGYVLLVSRLEQPFKPQGKAVNLQYRQLYIKSALSDNTGMASVLHSSSFLTHLINPPTT